MSMPNRTELTVTDTLNPMTRTTSQDVPDEAAQQRFWNDWNARHRGAGYNDHIDPPTMRRRDTAMGWIRELRLPQARILDLGCATGWLSAQLAEFGEVVGTDIADASITEARERYPHVRFECEDFSASSRVNGEFDIVVSLETLSHVADQTAFIRRIRDVLKPGGYLILTTQNRLVFERRSGVNPVGAGQIRHWLAPAEVRRLLKKDFVVRRFTTQVPDGQLGILRMINSTRLNALLGRVIPARSIERIKERLGLGQTIAVLAQRS